MIKVGVCGFGYWGPNLARALAANSAFSLVAVADRSPERQAKAKQAYPGVALFNDASELIKSNLVDAIAVATPVASHYPIASAALARRLHVLMEKPLASSVVEAEELVEISESTGAALLVDHVYIFHAAVRKLKELKDNGSLGTISYFDSLRVNLGLFQPDMNVLWDLAPHDFSIIDYIFEQEPIHIEATGYCHVNLHLPDIVYVTAHFASRMIAHLNLSWMSPVKVRRVAVGGSNKMAVWDDLNSEEKLKIYSSGINVQSEQDRTVIVPSYRIGDIYSPRLVSNEPVASVVSHFAEVIKSRISSPIDGRAGLRIVRFLEAAQTSLDSSLASLGAFDFQRETRSR